MNNKLKTYFPMIQEKETILHQIHQTPHLLHIFNNWTPEQQEEFLSICTGAKGVKILYDSFFKEIMNPETAPEYLEDFLSLLLSQRIKILCVLPNDNSRLADESSLLHTDIIVELENESIVNVEVQKIGYKFPGERCACYSSDLLLRQYKQVRSEKKKKFSYKDIRTVYTIILFEKSPREFHLFPDHYLHYFEQCSDTGLKLELLQKYLFIPLDIFHKNQHNKAITNKLDAWLMFFCTDSPEEIIQVIRAYPEFRILYERVYYICRNVEKIMGIFSKELQELDRNTIQYMIDEMQDQIDQQKSELDKKQIQIDQQQSELDEKQTRIDQQQSELDEKQIQIDQQKIVLEQALKHIHELENQLKKTTTNM